MNLDEARVRLLATQSELMRRIGSSEATERREVADKANDDAQLWEVSDLRDDLDVPAADELEQVNRALARLDAGEYGTCRTCGKPIADQRLEALPYATLCIVCADSPAP